MRLLAQVLTFLACVTCVTSAQQDSYNDLVDRYVDDPAQAVSALRGWPESDVRRAASEFARTHTSDERAEEAVMLHTDLALVLLASDVRPAYAQLRLAHDLIRQLLPAQPVEFRWRWYSVLTTLYWSLGRIDDAVHAADEALAAMPNIGHLHVLTGALDEARAASANVNLRGDPPLDSPRTRRIVEDELRLAADEYRDALKIDANDSDAHLRLGWVRSLQRRNNEARQELDAAQQAAHTPAQRYLARLFRAALDERLNHLADAARAYDDAIAQCPTCQSAYAGRVRVATTVGDLDTARERTAAFAATRKPDSRDPWWDEYVGGVDLESLAWLRNTVHK
jgi:tetratricopeptide (TPR) repeat protein